MKERYRDILIDYPDEVAAAEIKPIVDDSIDIWQKTMGKKVLGTLTITIDGEDFIIKTQEKSPLIRLRRITGYLSRLDNFADHKKVEEKERVDHILIGGE